MAYRCKFFYLSIWKVLLCTALTMQWQGISYQLRPFEQFCQTQNNVLVQVCLTFAGNNHQVVAIFDVGHNGGHYRLHLTADAIALYCTTILFADGKPHLRLCNVTCTKKYQKITITNAFGVFVHVVVLIVFFKSVNRLQIVFPLLCGKSVTTLCTTTCKYSTTTGCLHTSSKTVHFASLSFLRLVSSFHFSVSFYVSACAPKIIYVLGMLCYLFAKAHIDEHNIHRYFIKINGQSQVFGQFSLTRFV